LHNIARIWEVPKPNRTLAIKSAKSSFFGGNNYVAETGINDLHRLLWPCSLAFLLGLTATVLCSPPATSFLLLLGSRFVSRSNAQLDLSRAAGLQSEGTASILGHKLAKKQIIDAIHGRSQENVEEISYETYLATTVADETVLSTQDS
jgi:hypothetical protein